MPYNSEIHHRQSIRLKDYDYSQAGGYFVTVVAYQRVQLFGEIVDGMMVLNDWGKIAQREWFKTTELRPYIKLFVDEFVVMPNHVHGIIWIDGREDVDAQRDGHGGGRGAAPLRPYNMPRPNNGDPNGDPNGGPNNGDPNRDPMNNKNETPHVEAGSLGAVVRAYKSAVTYAVNAARQTRGMMVWQRNYYEHIIRNDGELNRIRKYIAENPLRWVEDQLYRMR